MICLTVGVRFLLCQPGPFKRFGMQLLFTHKVRRNRPAHCSALH
jgi:hypothetical protein